MLPMSERYYRRSSAVPLVPFLIAFTAAFGVTAVTSFLYATLNYFNTIIYATVAATAGFGFAVGKFYKIMLDRANVRNRVLSLATTAFLGGFAVYAAWVAYVWLLLRHDGVNIVILRPDRLWDLLQVFAADGIWEIGRINSYRPTGIELMLCWVTEAAIIIGGTIVPFVRIDAPYCESCSKAPTTVMCDVSFRMPNSIESLRHDLESEYYLSLHRLADASATPKNSLRAGIHKCPECDARWLTISKLQFTRNLFGETQTKVAIVIESLIIAKSDADALLRHSKVVADAEESLERNRTVVEQVSDVIEA